ncbi:MAG TPA: hypothetical protein VGI40_13975 [Pirellulaceae bacterium]
MSATQSASSSRVRLRTVAAPLSFILALIASLASISPAQETPPARLSTSPLGVRQQRVERMVQELEEKFKSLKSTIQDKEPQRAERLQQALNKAKELLLEKRMADVTRLLDQSQFDLAGGGQQTLLADLRELLEVLLNEQGTPADARQKWNLLSQWKQEIQKLTLAEREEKNASERLATQQRQQSTAPPRSTFEDLSRKQQSIGDQARDLAAKMQQSGPSSFPTGEARPGHENLSNAQQAMQRASGKLDNQNAAAANSDQQRALAELDAAQSEIDAALDELRDQEENQALADLERLFRDMLATQQQLTKQTAALEQKRLATNGQLTRADRNAIRLIGDDERRLQPLTTADGAKDAGLAGKAQLAADTLSTSSSASLAPVVTELKNEFLTLGNLLVDDLRTDMPVTTKQAHTETTLERLIETIQKLQAQKRQAAADAQAAGGNKSAASGSSGKQSQQSAQGGKQGGGSKGIDTDATAVANNSIPKNPWSQLRDKDRDPVYSAVKEKFPARYQQLIEQYYRSFGDDRRE